MKIPLIKIPEVLLIDKDQFCTIQILKIKEEFYELSEAYDNYSQGKSKSNVTQEALDIVTATLTFITHFVDDEELKKELYLHWDKIVNKRSWNIKGTLSFERTMPSDIGEKFSKIAKEIKGGEL